MKPLHCVSVFLVSPRAGLWLLTFLLALAQSGNAQEITKAVQIRQLTAEQARQKLPVHLRAVVTFRSEEVGMFVQDNTGGVATIPKPGNENQAKVGDEVEIWGVTDPGIFAPAVAESKIRVLGQGQMPADRDLSFDSLMTGTEDSQWVSTRGMVRSVQKRERFPGEYELKVAVSTGSFLVRSRELPAEYASNPEKLIGAVIQARGVCGGNFTRRRQLRQLIVFSPRGLDLKVMQPSLTDVAPLQLRPLNDILQFSANEQYGGRVRVQGTVTYQQKDGSFYVSDGPTGVRVLPTLKTNLSVGEKVELMAFPAMQQNSLLLEDAAVKKLPSTEVPAPKKINLADLNLDANEGNLVQLEADLLSQVPSGQGRSLVLQHANVVFHGLFENDPKGRVADLKPGSTLLLSGILLRRDQNNNAQSPGLALLLRADSDVVLLNGPGFWSREKLMFLVAGLVCAFLVVLAGVVGHSRRRAFQAKMEEEALRKAQQELEKHVADRTRELSNKNQELQQEIAVRTRLENELYEERNLLSSLLNNVPDFIYFKDRHSRFIRINKAVAQLHHLASTESVVGKTDYDLFPKEHADVMLADEQKILKSGHPIHREEQIQTAEGLKCVLTTKMALRSPNNEIVGTFGISRDITPLKRGEAELKKAYDDMEKRVQERTAELSKSNALLLEQMSVRTRIEKELAHERDLLEALMENIPDRIYFKDKQSRFIKCSRAVAASLSMNDPSQALGKTDFDFFTEEHAQAAIAEEKKIMETGEARIGVVEKETWRDGRVSWVLTTKMPLRNREGEVIGTFGVSKNITELKKAEEALAQERNLLRSLIDTLPCTVFIKDLQGRFVVCNLALASVMKASSPEQVVGKTDFDFFPRELAQKYFADDQALMRSGEPLLNCEEECVDSAGNASWALTTKVPIRDSQGKISGLVGVCLDITQHKKMEQALRVSEERRKTLLASLPQRILFKDQELRFVVVNEVLAADLGYKADDLIGKTDYDLFPKELAEKYRADDFRIMQSRKVETLVEKNVVNGVERYVEVVKAPVISDSGEVIGVLGVFTDVTQKKAEEEELRRVKTHLEAVIENLPIVVFIKDAKDLRMLTWNRAGEDLIGIKRSEIIGKNDHDLFSKTEADFYTARDREALQGKRLVDVPEEIMDTPHRGRRIIHTKKIPILDESGEPIYLLGIAEDVTSRKHAEEELKKAKEAAEAANRAKSDFLANMSHEIRTPMNGVIGMTNLLLDTPLTPEQRDFAETVRNSGDALLTILNDILDFSKIEAGKLAFETLDFDLREVVEGTLELVAQRAQMKGIEIASWIQPEVPVYLRGDPGRLRQVLLNLVGNAIKFTSQGEVFLEVSRKAVQDNAVELYISVKDTGIGISQEAQDRLFQAFSQADTSTTRKYGGTGLGLAICKKLVEMMQGNIGVKSVIDQGSTFWFTVKLEQQKEVAVQPLANKDSLAGVRVLIVDDNTTNRTILHYQVLGWRMRNGGSVASGREALAVLRREAAAGDPYQVAILDMQMPEMDGLELARVIKSEPAISNMKLILLTSLCQRLNPDELKRAGIEAWLVKPAKQAQLFNTLVSVLRDERPLDLVAAPSNAAPAAESATKSVKILLAEDNVVNQKVALKQLKKLGYNADVVANGLEVLDAIKRINYDVILMDCHMPEMDGYEATRSIRTTRIKKGLHPIRIIAMTANAMQGDREKCIEAGMDDYISKPVKIEELQAALERNLEVVKTA